jgi:hypothetical protein
MNLHGMVAGAIGIVNPFIQVEIQRSTGYDTAPDGSRTPNFDRLSGPAQVQDLSTDDLKLLADAGINIQGIRKNVYLNGSWAGVVRAEQTGGDIFNFNGAHWLVTMVPEAWPDWCKVIVTMQSPKPASAFLGAPPAPGHHAPPLIEGTKS